MSELQIFDYENSKVRVYEDGWFVASDVCAVLEIMNVSDAVRKLDEDEKMTLALTDSHLPLYFCIFFTYLLATQGIKS